MDALFADKAFDADWLLQDLNARGAKLYFRPKLAEKYSATACRFKACN